MSRISLLIKPVSSLCNMNCHYCFYVDVVGHRHSLLSRVMDNEVMVSVIEKGLSFDTVHFAFQGGEPTLAGLKFFKNFIREVNKRKNSQKISYAIQTNGTLLDKEWLRFFKNNDFLIGVSIDGTKACHDSLRSIGNKPTFDRIINNIHLMKKFGLRINILTVITPLLTDSVEEIYTFYKKEGFSHIQFIPCLPDLNQLSNNFSLSPYKFYEFYKKLFNLWYQDYLKGKYVSISLFEDLIMIFSGRMPRTCGMLGSCQIQYIIESDGNVYPCDFYALDCYRMGNILTDELDTMREGETAQEFIRKPESLDNICLKCRFVNICQGNCKRMKSILIDKDYCGYQMFLEETYQIFYTIAKELSY